MHIISMKYNYDTIEVGDVILYRPAWGDNPPRMAEVAGMSLVPNVGDKEGGVSVDKVERWQVEAQRVIFDLSNGHWCYSSQVDGVAEREDVE